MSSNDVEWFRTDFRPHFDQWVFGPINRLVNSDDALIGFIFMTCSIDYLASFWWGKSTKGRSKKAYTDFVNQYFEKGRYDAASLYDSLRNGLVHLFTIKDKKYALTHNNPSRHLTRSNGHIVLNASNFRDDLVAAANKYFDDVESKPDLLARLNERLSRDGFLNRAPI